MKKFCRFSDGRKPAGGPGVLDAAQVVIFVQGDLEELDQIVEYVRDDVPVIILEGCNGTADVLAGCINSWYRRMTTRSLCD